MVRMWFLSLTIIYLTRSQCIIIKQIGEFIIKMTNHNKICDLSRTHYCFVIKLTDNKLLTPRPQTNEKIIIFIAQGTL